MPRSLVFLEQVVKLAFTGIRRDLPEAAVSIGRVDLFDLRKVHFDDLVLGGGAGSGLAIRLVRSLILILILVFLILVLVVLVSRRVVLHRRGEALESLHDVVHVDIELVLVVVLVLGR